MQFCGHLEDKSVERNTIDERDLACEVSEGSRLYQGIHLINTFELRIHGFWLTRAEEPAVVNKHPAA